MAGDAPLLERLATLPAVPAAAAVELLERLSQPQTDPVIGVCISPIGPSVSVQIDAKATATFAIFVTASGTIVLDPATNRIFVVFADGGSVVRGRTSVAVTTQ